jgi:hypothetical protein
MIFGNNKVVLKQIIRKIPANSIFYLKNRLYPEITVDNFYFRVEPKNKIKADVSDNFKV